MNFLELVRGGVYVFILTAFFVVVVTSLINLFVPGAYAFVSLGYSMCGERTPYLDFLTLEETTCSIVPGDELITVYDYPPKVGDVVCVNTNKGVICHRVVRYKGEKPCMEGDAAKWELCFDENSYIGTVVAKLPRIFAMPALTLKSVVTGNLRAIELINAGSYHPFDMGIKNT